MPIDQRPVVLSNGPPKVVAAIRDITTIRADAIVNAANVTLLGGGGVDGAIHRAAGPLLREICSALPEVEPGVRCRVGEAVITEGCFLPALYVIHTVGPMFPGARDPVYQGEITRNYDPKERLASCVRSCLTIAQEQRLKHIVFPAISCGVFGCTIPVFAKVAREVVLDGDWGPLALVLFVLFSTEEAESFIETWKMLG